MFVRRKKHDNKLDCFSQEPAKKNLGHFPTMQAMIVTENKIEKIHEHVNTLNDEFSQRLL